jgi:hypothetical protein
MMKRIVGAKLAEGVKTCPNYYQTAYNQRKATVKKIFVLFKTED